MSAEEDSWINKAGRTGLGMIIGTILIYVPAIIGGYLVGDFGFFAGAVLGFFLAIKLILHLMMVGTLTPASIHRRSTCPWSHGPS